MKNLMLEALTTGRTTSPTTNQNSNPTNTSNTQTQQYVAMANLVKNSSNPTAVLFNLAQQNPDVANVLNMVKGAGSPKDAFYAMAKAMNADPNQVLNLLR